MKLRAKHRFHISIVSFLCVGTLVASLCSCGKKETQDYAFAGTNGDASSLGVISVQVREDGSGTRNQFEEYLGISMSEDNVDKYKDMKQCTVLSSGSAMASAINESKNGIGYASYGQMQGDSKALAVDGIVCTRESIADPLTRDFTLAWVDSPNALRDDFVKYMQVQVKRSLVRLMCRSRRKQRFWRIRMHRGHSVSVVLPLWQICLRNWLIHIWR